MSYWVYMARCSGEKLYTGVTTDVARRIHEHNHNRKGARYTRANQPVNLAAAWEVNDWGSALRLEAAIKKCPKRQKEQFVIRPELLGSVFEMTFLQIITSLGELIQQS